MLGQRRRQWTVDSGPTVGQYLCLLDTHAMLESWSAFSLAPPQLCHVPLPVNIKTFV